jgi:hypothetical protein|tara:strand:- start:66 stop:179 length:114 start_codon:yes stop_codon:yes gene_type:complete
MIGKSKMKKHIAPTATAHVQHHPRKENKEGLHLGMPP